MDDKEGCFGIKPQNPEVKLSHMGPNVTWKNAQETVHGGCPSKNILDTSEEGKVTFPTQSFAHTQWLDLFMPKCKK